MSVGFEDWNRTTKVAGPVKITVNQVVAGSTTFGKVYAGDYGYLNVVMNTIGLTSYYKVVINWILGVNLASSFATNAAVIGPGMNGVIQFPVLGQAFSLTIAPLTAVDVNPIFVSVIASNNKLGTFLPTPLIYFNGSIGAGAGVPTPASYVAAGKATLSLWNSANHPGHASIDYWDDNALGWELYTFVEVTAAIRAASVTVGLPAAPVRLTVTNDDTASRGFTASVTLQAEQ